MEWAVESGDADIACAIAGGLGWFWNMGGRIDDTWRWITAALSLGEPTRPTRRIRALGWAGLVGIVHDSERAIEYGAEAVARARALGDDSALALVTMLSKSSNENSTIASVVSSATANADPVKGLPSKSVDTDASGKTVETCKRYFPTVGQTITVPCQ